MSRRIPRGITKVYACPLIAGTSPTRPEITAGVDITGSIAAISGFGLTSATVPTPDLGSLFDKTVPGIDSAGDSSFTMWDEVASGSGTDPARDVLVKGSDLALYFMPYGDTAGLRSEVWRVTVTGANDQQDMQAARQYMVGFSIREVPTQDAVVPAAV